uniref:Peptidase M14 carboxypeptidase A domain-containing protein n=1 Tax=Setaria digitata TaxID=48799 RepID=A0A915Q092_9BILA
MICKERRYTEPDFDFNRYHSLEEYENYLEDVAKAFPSFVKLEIIGFTHEGRRLLALKLVTKYEKDPEITDYIDKLNFYILPILNPDGFVFSRTSTSDLVRHWRKNRAPENCTGTLLFRKNLCCEGVDLNRNYDFDFRQTLYPFNNPCSDEFQGPFPFSEPESRAVRDFITSINLRDKTDAVISLHTHGQMIILPYNHRRKTYPTDYAHLLAVAKKVKDEIKRMSAHEYNVGTAADMIGPATGSATDWIKYNTPTKYVYVFELPPAYTTWFAFQVKPHKLLPIATETWNGVRVIINQCGIWTLSV